MTGASVAEIGLLPSQFEMLQCEMEWAAVRGGKGSGKTLGLSYWMLKRLERYPIAAHFVAGADYEQLRRGFFQSFCDALSGFGWVEGEDFRYRESPSPMILLLGSGARLKAISAELALRIESVEWQTLLLEEPQTWPHGERVWQILQTRLRHSKRSAMAYSADAVAPDGEIIPRLRMQGRMSFNPPVRGSWLHRVVDEEWAADGFPCWRVSVRDNYLLLDADEYVHRLERSLPPTQWPSQIDGHWATVSGGAIREFDQGIHGNPPAGIPRGIDTQKPLLWSLDFNVGHMRSVIAQAFTQRLLMDGVVIHHDRPPEHRTRLEIPGWARRILRFIGEIALDDAGSQQVAVAFIARFGDVARKNGVVLYGDSTGGNRSQIDGITSNWSTIVDALRAENIPFSYNVTRNGPPFDRILRTDATFRSGAGFGATVDVDECPEFVADLENVQWNKLGTDFDKKSDPRRSHSADAAGYLCVGFGKAVALADLKQRSAAREPVLSR